jgi:predicted Fe-S protein YdhL (DUF1289 family)
MTAAQQVEYKAQYEAAKAQWTKMTPDQQKAAIEAARQKKLKDLSYAELVGQRDDMQQETAAQSGALKAQSDAWKAKWDSLTPQQKQAVRQASGRRSARSSRESKRSDSGTIRTYSLGS